MQIKIVIGTVAFMLTMIILGFAALREPSRLQQFTLARDGRSIETGASLFQGNCATCHGVDGSAQDCFDANGNPIACVGFPLNTPQLVCGDRTARMEALGWEGSKEQFIVRTIAAGRAGTQMPTWSERYGGPMRDDQIQNVAMFVLNWESEELCSQPVVTYEWPELVEEFLAQEDIEEGDPELGAAAYETYGCTACHGDPAEPGTNPVGPWLGDIAEVGATRVEGQSAAQYVYESILDPNAFIAPDCPTGPCPGPPSQMRQDYPSTIGSNPSDMAHLLAYLLGEALPEE